MSLVPGPIAPRAKRGRSSVLYLSHAARAISAEAFEISYASSARSNSPMTWGMAPKLSVSTASEPASRKDSWISWITSGRVWTSTSVQFSLPR